MTKEEKKLRACYHWTEWERKAKELEKENAELKELLNCNNCSELSEEECEVCAEYSHFKCKRKDQLVKAKEIIKDLMSFSVQLCNCRHTVDFEKTREQAEQFLKENGGKK